MISPHFYGMEKSVLAWETKPNHCNLVMISFSCNYLLAPCSWHLHTLPVWCAEWIRRAEMAPSGGRIRFKERKLGIRTGSRTFGVTDHQGGHMKSSSGVQPRPVWVCLRESARLCLQKAVYVCKDTTRGSQPPPQSPKRQWQAIDAADPEVPIWGAREESDHWVCMATTDTHESIQHPNDHHNEWGHFSSLVCVCAYASILINIR